jgi:hypothetical protein
MYEREYAIFGLPEVFLMTTSYLDVCLWGKK